MNEYKFFMTRLINNEWEKEISLEDYFNGMKYCSCTGLSTKGKPKNIYTENYAETEDLRIFLPDSVIRENTDLEFEFAFKGEGRRDMYDRFCDWITGYRIRYWDTCRERQVEMVLLEAVEPDKDYLIGSEPFMVAKFKFKNLRGSTIIKN